MLIVESLKSGYQALISDPRFTEILAGSSVAILAKIAATGLTLLSSVIIARTYGPDMLGTLAVINSFLAFAAIVATLGLSSSILRLIPEHSVLHSNASAFSLYRKSVVLVVAGSLLIGLMLFSSSGGLAVHVFHKPRLAQYLVLASLVVVARSLSDLNLHSARGLKQVRMFALLQVLPSGAMLLGLIVLTVLFGRGDVPVYAQFAAWAVAAVAGSWGVDREFKKRSNPGDEVHPVPVNKILSVSIPMLMTSIFGYLSLEAGTIILGMYRTESEVGYYSMAAKIATLTSFILTAINTMAGPKYSELYHGNRLDDLFYIAYKSAKLIFWTTTPILFGLLLLGYPILTILFGSPFGVAYAPLVILILGQFVNSISGSTGLFMNMTDNHTALVRIMALAALTNIGLNVLLIPHYGIIGAAVAATASISLWNVYILIFIRLKYNRSICYVPLFTAHQRICRKG